MSRTPRHMAVALVGALTLLITFLFSISLLVASVLSLSVAGYFGVVLVTALITALVIAVGVLSGTSVLANLMAGRRSITTSGDLHHPLLERLKTEAPGTYHHSLGVANLAEAAARAIGANAELARVGSYYHDIGKLANPKLFIENIDPKHDPHLKLDPKESARIIINHVVDGIEIAREANLPEQIVHFIPEHTGTTLVYFFYVKAKLAAPKGEEVHKRDFRYPGPKPMSRETALVMLADTVEAAVRSHEAKSATSIKRVIDEVVGEKIDDTQLDISGLTEADVEAAKAAFLEVLERVHHKRIKYPKRQKHD